MTCNHSSNSLKYLEWNRIFFLCKTAEICNLIILIVYKHSDCYILANIIKDIIFSWIFVPILAIKGNSNIKFQILLMLLFYILNILSQELFITMVIVNFSNIFVTSSHLFNSLKHFQCNKIFFLCERAKI